MTLSASVTPEASYGSKLSWLLRVRVLEFSDTSLLSVLVPRGLHAVTLGLV